DGRRGAPGFRRRRGTEDAEPDHGVVQGGTDLVPGLALRPNRHVVGPNRRGTDQDRSAAILGRTDPCPRRRMEPTDVADGRSDSAFRCLPVHRSRPTCARWWDRGEDRQQKVKPGPDETGTASTLESLTYHGMSMHRPGRHG